MNIGGKVRYFLPEHATAAASIGATAANYLRSLKPTQAQNSPLDKPLPVNPVQQQKYDRALDVAQQPLMVLHYAKRGTLQPQDVQTLHVLYPQLHAKIVEKTYDELAKAHAAGTRISYPQRVSLSMLMGKPLDSTLSQTGMMAVAMANAPKGPPPQPQGAGGHISKSTATTQQKVNKIYETPNQAGAARRLGA